MHVTKSNPFQSAYRPDHSTETALLATLDGCFSAIDGGRSSVLLSLDLSAAFDTIDHANIMKRLQTSFRICRQALEWIRSYLTDRRQFVRIGQSLQTRACVILASRKGRCLGRCYLWLMFRICLQSPVNTEYLSTSMRTTRNSLWRSPLSDSADGIR